MVVKQAVKVLSLGLGGALFYGSYLFLDRAIYGNTTNYWFPTICEVSKDTLNVYKPSVFTMMSKEYEHLVTMRKNDPAWEDRVSGPLQDMLSPGKKNISCYSSFDLEHFRHQPPVLSEKLFYKSMSESFLSGILGGLSIFAFTFIIILLCT